jgi:asparagine synthase (glutamine-hydrolysing)
VPFLDLKLMELAESLPPSLKIRHGRRKWVLKEALAPWTAPETRRQPKIGFDVAVDEWFRGELRGQLEERLLGGGSACREHFRADTLRQMIEEHAQGRHDHKRSLFSLLTFEMWHERSSAPRSWPAPAARRAAAAAGRAT